MSTDGFETDDEIELLGVAWPEDTAESAETLTTGRSKGNVVLVLGALVVVAFAVAALGSDSTRDAGPSTPTTIPPTSSAPPSTEALVPDRPVAQIGGGPELVWQRVEFDFDATDFEWVEDGFLGQAGESDYVLGSNGTLTVSESRSAAGEAPIRSSARVRGDGTDNPSELTFVGLEQERVDVIPMVIPDSDLVDVGVRLAVERKGDQVLILQTLRGVLDVERFNEQFDIDDPLISSLMVSPSAVIVSGDDGVETLPIEGLELSAADLVALRTIEEPVHQLSVAEVNGTATLVEVDLDRIDWIAAIGDDFVVGGAELRRSADGMNWQQTGVDTPRFGGLLPPGPDGVMVGLAFDADQNLVTTSADGARTWDDVPSPLTNVWQFSSVAPVIAITGWMDEAFVPSPAGWSVLTPAFELRVGADDDSFALLTRSGTPLLSGFSRDPSSGFRFAPGSDDIWFVDPTTDVEIARFPRLLFAAAFAASRTLDGQPQLIALADVSRGDPIEWSLTRVNELFGPEALAVDFIPGDGWFLADVTTMTGRELYLAEVPAATRPLSERRHPTYAEMSRGLAEQD